MNQLNIPVLDNFNFPVYIKYQEAITFALLASVASHGIATANNSELSIAMKCHPKTMRAYLERLMRAGMIIFTGYDLERRKQYRIVDIVNVFGKAVN